MNLYEKLMEVQQSLVAPKNQFNKFGNYKYRSCEDILEGLKPCLKKVKAVVQIMDSVEMIGERIYVKATAVFYDCESGESLLNTAYAREEELVKGMSSSQITGAASSYARKYALNGLFCIDDVKDADSRDNSVTAEVVGKISAKNLKRLADQCEKTGINPSVILEYYDVKNISDLTEEQFKDVCSNWSVITSGD